MSSSDHYFLRWRGRRSGPYTLAQIQAKLDTHEIGTFHEVLVGDRSITVQDLLDQRVGSKPEGQERVPPAGPASEAPRTHGPARARRAKSRVTAALDGGGMPPEAASLGMRTGRDDAAADSQRVAPADVSIRRRWLFGLLGLVGGYLGLHNFFAGYRVRGLAQLALTGVTMWLGFGWVASWLWALVEVVVQDRDGEGLIMR